MGDVAKRYGWRDTRQTNEPPRNMLLVELCPCGLVKIRGFFSRVFDLAGYIKIIAP
jgi:hypothetical protein